MYDADLLSSSMNHNSEEQQQQQVRLHHSHGQMSHHQHHQSHHYFGAAAKSLNFPSVHPHQTTAAALAVQHPHHFVSPTHHQTYIKQESSTNHLNAFYDNFVNMTGSGPHQTLATKLA